MSIQSSFLKAHLICRELGLTDSGLSGLAWPDWVDTLDEDDVETIQGFLIKKFGRKFIEDPPRQANFYVFSYLSKLEAKFSDWLNSREMIDYAIASHCMDCDIKEESCYWSEMHQKIWHFRRYTENNVVPIEVQMMPLIESSLSAILSKHIDPKIKINLSNVENFNLANDLICLVETGCNHLGHKVLFDDLLQPLRKITNPVPSVVVGYINYVDLSNEKTTPKSIPISYSSSGWVDAWREQE